MATAADLDGDGPPGAKAAGRMITAAVYVRDPRPMRRAVDDGVDTPGGLDVVVANAGVCAIQRWDEVTPELWDTMIGINLTGAWNTAVAAIPHLHPDRWRFDHPRPARSPV